MAEIIEESRQGLEKMASDGDIDFGINIAADVGLFPGDPRAIRAMLLNLVENSFDACRMDGEKGKEKLSHSVRIGVWREAPWMVVEVEDNGIGMKREN